MLIKKDVLLKNFNTLRVGGHADFFASIKTEKDLMEVADLVNSKKLNFFVLGGGSNILVPDSGFSGIVIHMKTRGISWDYEKSKVRVIAMAGENWDFFVKKTVDKNLYGLENLSGIPGTVGGAPVQNIGAYGAELKNVLRWVEVFDVKKRLFLKIPNKKCKFGYRTSMFKRQASRRYVITKVCFDLKKSSNVNYGYKDLAEYFSVRKIKNPSLVQLRNAVIKIRSLKFPDQKKFGTAGSFFQNPIISLKKYKNILKRYPLLPSYSVNAGKVKIPLAWVIDKICGLKGYREGNVGIFKNQAIVLVNHGGATAEEIKKFSEKIKDDVKHKLKINIENEVREI